MQNYGYKSSEIKFNISAKNATAYDLLKTIKKIQTFSTSTIKIYISYWAIFICIIGSEKYCDGRNSQLSFIVSIPPIISIQQA